MQALYHSSGFKMLVWSKLLVFTGKKLAFRVFFRYIFEYWSLPYVHLASTSVMNETRPSQLFTVSSASVYYTGCKLKNKNAGGLGMRLGLTGYVHSSSRPTCRHSSLTNYYTEYIHHYPIIHWISFSRSPSEATDTIIIQSIFSLLLWASAGNFS